MTPPSGSTPSTRGAGLDALIADRLAATGADQVDLAGHSLGTAVVQGYLEQLARAGRPGGLLHQHRRPDRHGAAGRGADAGRLGRGQPRPGHRRRRELLRSTRATCRWPPRPRRSPGCQPDRGAPGHHGHRRRAARAGPGISGEANLFPSNVEAGACHAGDLAVKASTGERRGHHPRATSMRPPTGRGGRLRVVAGSRTSWSSPGATARPVLFLHAPVPAQRPLRALAHVRAGDRDDLVRDQSDYTTSLTVTWYKECADQGAQSDVPEVAGTNSRTPALAPGSSGSTPCSPSTTASTASPTWRRPSRSCSRRLLHQRADLAIPATTPPNATVPIRMVSRTAVAPARSSTSATGRRPPTTSPVQFPDFD